MTEIQNITPSPPYRGTGQALVLSPQGREDYMDSPRPEGTRSGMGYEIDWILFINGMVLCKAKLFRDLSLLRV